MFDQFFLDPHTNSQMKVTNVEVYVFLLCPAFHQRCEQHTDMDWCSILLQQSLAWWQPADCQEQKSGALAAVSYTQVSRIKQVQYITTTHTLN